MPTPAEDRYVEYMKQVAATFPADMPYEEKQERLLQALDTQFKGDMDQLIESAKEDLGPALDAVLVSAGASDEEAEADALTAVRQSL